MHNKLHDVGMVQQWAHLQRAELLLRNGVSHEQQLLVGEAFEQLMRSLAAAGRCGLKSYSWQALGFLHPGNTA